MGKIGIFFGIDSGNVEVIVEKISKVIGNVEVVDVVKVFKE